MTLLVGGHPARHRRAERHGVPAQRRDDRRGERLRDGDAHGAHRSREAAGSRHALLERRPDGRDPDLRSRTPVADSTRGFIVWVDENGNFDANGVAHSDRRDGRQCRRRRRRADAHAAAWRRAARSAFRRTAATSSFAPTGFTRPRRALCFPSRRAARPCLFCDDRGRRVAAGSLSSARVVRVDRPGPRPSAAEHAADVGSAHRRTIGRRRRQRVP